ncbi:MAG: hypothetical protein K2N60_09540 [Oscillospiraceae bacterium]|nr:hypothetical protein [Oscillospiraceae bacterium]
MVKAQPFVQCRYRRFFLVSETKFAAITIDGGKHKGSAFVFGRVYFSAV